MSWARPVPLAVSGGPLHVPGHHPPRVSVGKAPNPLLTGYGLCGSSLCYILHFCINLKLKKQSLFKEITKP